MEGADRAGVAEAAGEAAVTGEGLPEGLEGAGEALVGSGEVV